VKDGLTVLTRFAEAVIAKLREMKISQAFHPGTSKDKSRFKQLLHEIDELGGLEADIKMADRLEIRDDMKTAAKHVAEHTFSQALEAATSTLMEVMNACRWHIAKVVAAELAYRMTTTQAARQATLRGDHEESGRFRYLVTLSYQGSELMTDFLRRIADGIKSHSHGVIIENAGISTDPTDTVRHPGRPFFVLTALSFSALVPIQAWIEEDGCGPVGIVEMTEHPLSTD
jgi:hypothetical protein